MNMRTQNTKIKIDGKLIYVIMIKYCLVGIILMVQSVYILISDIIICFKIHYLFITCCRNSLRLGHEYFIIISAGIEITI